VYELGYLARPLTNEITNLLHNNDLQIVSDAIIALRGCAQPKDTYALGKIITYLGHPEPFIQRGLMSFIRYCEPYKLKIGLRTALEWEPDPVFRTINEAVDSKGYFEKETLENLMRHASPIAKRFGVGLAMRAQSIVDLNMVEIAETWDDEEALGCLKSVREHPGGSSGMMARISERYPRAPEREKRNYKKQSNGS